MNSLLSDNPGEWIMRIVQVLGVLLLTAVGTRPAEAIFIYDIEAVAGMFAGSTLTGSISLVSATAGLTVWNLNDASNYNFYSSYGSGLSFGPSDLTTSNDVRFDVGIGSAVLTPVLPDATPGYSPDWRLDTMSGDTVYVLGIGHDLTKPLWSLAQLGGIGNLDLGNSLASGPPAWRLVLRENPGDHNKDGNVNVLDYVIWRIDPDNNGGPDGYYNWIANYSELETSNGTGESHRVRVPEPAGTLLPILGAALGMIRPRRVAWRVPEMS